jgi:hypothetical protein
MSAEHMGIFLLLLLIGAVVLAFVLEVVALARDVRQMRASASVHENHDRHVSRRLAAIVAAAAFVLVAGIIAVDLIDPDWLLSATGRRIAHPYALLFYGALFCLVAWLCGIKPTQPVLLFCLTLPGLIAFPLVGLVGGSMYNPVIVAVWVTLIAFFIQPAGWILLFIGLGQARLVNKPAGNFTMGGLVRFFLIFYAYIFGSIY